MPRRGGEGGVDRSHVVWETACLYKQQLTLHMFYSAVVGGREGRLRYLQMRKLHDLCTYLSFFDFL
jgi:hypothetical protein